MRSFNFFTTTKFLLSILLITSFMAKATDYPLTLVDGSGQQVVIDSKPTKISSKTLFTDELLIFLVQPQNLTSLTHLASDETFSTIASIVPEGVEQIDLNVEAIIANQPDIVFTANWSDAGKVAQLRQAGITVYLIQTPFTLDAIKQQILTIGEIVGESQNAQSIVKQMDEKLTREIIEPKNKLVALDYNSWGTANTKNTTWQTILDHAGLINAVESYESDGYGQTQMSKELVITINPDVLFLPGWVYGEEGAAEAFRQSVISDPALQNVKAIKNDRVYWLPESLRGTFGQYIVDAIISANHQVYGEN